MQCFTRAYVLTVFFIFPVFFFSPIAGAAENENPESSSAEERAEHALTPGCSATSLEADCVFADVNDDAVTDFRLRGVGYFDNGLVIGNTPEKTAALHLEEGDFLMRAEGENHMKFQRTGLKGKPEFVIGRIIEAGIGFAELRVLYADEQTRETKVLGIEGTGTIASVRRDYGSHFEGFLEREREPLFRLNSYPTTRLELGEGGDTPADVAFQRNEEPGSFSFFSGKVEKLSSDSKGTVFNPGGAALDFSILGTEKENLLSIHGKENKISIGAETQWGKNEEGKTGLTVDADGDLILPSYNQSTRPSPGKPGRIIFNTDEGTVNIDTGNSWISVQK